MSTIRKATIEDVDRILELINFYGEKELLLRKSPFKVFKTLQNFFVAEENEKVIGCASLIILWRDLGEICSLAVEEGLTRKGIGRELVLRCIEEARKLKVPKIIVLTYQDEFFKKLGFHLVDKDSFPRKLMWECLECPRLERCDERAYLMDLTY
jgi:amino-acid N-acetyltransferase